MDLTLPSERPFLSWTVAGPPLVKFVLVVPHFRYIPQRPLPKVVADSLRRTSATRSSWSARVVSHHLDGLLRIRGFECIATRYRMRFALFPDPLTTSASPGPEGPKFTDVPRTCRFPQRTHPPKNFPRQQPFRITAAIPLLPLPSLDPSKHPKVLTKIDSRLQVLVTKFAEANSFSSPASNGPKHFAVRSTEAEQQHAPLPMLSH